MPESQKFEEAFDQLRGILKKYEGRLVVHIDKPHTFYLDTKTIGKNRKPIFFGAASVRKGYVSFYLMPVYAFPDLLEGISPNLKKRMQGKSCFNFKDAEPGLIKELARLTKQGFDRYKKEGLI